MAVNGQSVEGLLRNHVIQLIRSSGTQITVKVRPSSEMIEFSLRYVVPLNGNAVTDARRFCVRQHLAEVGSLRQLSDELWKVGAGYFYPSCSVISTKVFHRFISLSTFQRISLPRIFNF